MCASFGERGEGVWSWLSDHSDLGDLRPLLFPKGYLHGRSKYPPRYPVAAAVAAVFARSCFYLASLMVVLVG